MPKCLWVGCCWTVQQVNVEKSKMVSCMVFISDRLPSTAFGFTLVPGILVLSTANDLVKLQNIVSHTNQSPLATYLLQSA